MSSQTIALQCPSCGSSETRDSRAARFGYEFTCQHCHTASVLVINSKLHIRSAGEHVCILCGRVASAAAQFCQCGASLITQCAMCGGKFPADHALCDMCAWPVDADPSTATGLALRAERAIAQLNSSNFGRTSPAIDELARLAPSAEAADAIATAYIRTHASTTPAAQMDKIYVPQAALACLKNMGPMAIPALARICDYDPSDATLTVLADFGPSAAPALLAPLTKAIRQRPSKILLRMLPRCGPPAIPLLIELLSSVEWCNDAMWALSVIGRPALPHLEPLAGFFADRKIKPYARRLIKCIKKYK